MRMPALSMGSLSGWTAAVFLFLAVACSGPVPLHSESNSPLMGLGSKGGPHLQLKRDPSEPRAAEAPSDAHLIYYGGHVVSNARVVQVLYGSGTYLPELAGANMGSFYQQVLNSAYV